MLLDLIWSSQLVIQRRHRRRADRREVALVAGLFFLLFIDGSQVEKFGGLNLLVEWHSIELIGVHRFALILRLHLLDFVVVE